MLITYDACLIVVVKEVHAVSYLFLKCHYTRITFSLISQLTRATPESILGFILHSSDNRDTSL